MINKFLSFLIIIGIILSVVFNNNPTTLLLSSCKDTFDLVLEIFPLMALWLGIMNIAKESGLLIKLAKIFRPLFKYIFTEIPENHESLGYISSNFIMSMMGLSNAATPFGIKAMQSMQTLNRTETASNSMVTFLVLNTSGITIIPSTIISLRMLNNSNNPEIIIPFCIIASTLSLIVGLIIDRIFRGIYG